MYFKIGRFEFGSKPAVKADADLEAIKAKIVEEMEAKSVSSTWNKLFITGQAMTLGDNAVQFPMQDIASVYKAISVIAENVPQAQFGFYTLDGEELMESSDARALKARFARPNAQQSGNDFLQEWTGYFALYGEAFIRKVANTVGEMIGREIPQLVNLNPKCMTEKIDRATGLITAWQYTTQGGTIIIPAEEIIHTKSFNPYNPYRGLSPLSPIDDEIEIDQNALTFNNAFFKNDATPNFVLSTDQKLGKDQVERLNQWWKQRYGGAKKAYQPAVLESGLKASTVMTTHRDMEFIEQKKLMREEILGIWKAPKALFNITENLNYATFQGQMKVFWFYCLMPILRKFEDSVNEFIVKPFDAKIVMKFDLKNVPAFQEDFNGKVTTAKTLFDMGFTANEVNEKLELGFDYAEWRDKWWISPLLAPAGEAPAYEDFWGSGDDAQTENANDEKAGKANSEKGLSNALPPTLPQRTVKQLAILKAFSRRQSSLEKSFESKVSRYLYEVRKAVMATPDADLVKGALSVNWTTKNDLLLKYTKPLIAESIKQGVEQGRDVLGRTKGLEDDILQQATQSYLEVRCSKIQIVNVNLEKAIQNRIRRAVETATTAGGTATEIAESIEALGGVVRNELKNFFNDSGYRAKLIARTETCGALNGGSELYYKHEGVKRKMWVTSHDESTRESHRECEAQGAIPMNQHFHNGLSHPADQTGDVAEIANCRCTLAPITE
jgi:HK97 family phage portal protein